MIERTFNADIVGFADLEITYEYVVNPYIAATMWQPAEGGEVEDLVIVSVIAGDNTINVFNHFTASIQALIEAAAESDATYATDKD